MKRLADVPAVSKREAIELTARMIDEAVRRKVLRASPTRETLESWDQWWLHRCSHWLFDALAKKPDLEPAPRYLKPYVRAEKVNGRKRRTR